MPDLGSLPERAVTVDQTHESVVVGERFVVKWLRDPVPDHPAPAILAHLTQVGFAGTAALTGVLSDAAGLRALVTEYLPGARDGWEWCVEDLLAGDLAFPARLGALTAALHAALATPSAVLPDPITPAGRTWSSGAVELLSVVLSETGGHNGAWLKSREPALRSGLELPAGLAGTPLIRVHGDLHVGQILRWDGGLAVIDFDGNPAVRAEPMQPAARDVAQLLMSLEHVAAIAARQQRGVEPSPDLVVTLNPGFIGGARADFLDAYRSVLAGRDLAHLLDERLLPAFEIEQELRELHYANRFLPRWRYAPMAALRQRYPGTQRSSLWP